MSISRAKIARCLKFNYRGIIFAGLTRQDGQAWVNHAPVMRFAKSTEDIIADFRGLPRTVTSSSRKQPVPLDNLLVVLKEQYKLEAPSPERSLVQNWEAVFGSNLAGRCHPVRIKDERTLIISVTNQTLRSELQFQKRAILQRIQQLPHCSQIGDIRIRS